MNKSPEFKRESEHDSEKFLTYRLHWGEWDRKGTSGWADVSFDKKSKEYTATAHLRGAEDGWKWPRRGTGATEIDAIKASIANTLLEKRKDLEQYGQGAISTFGPLPEGVPPRGLELR